MVIKSRDFVVVNGTWCLNSNVELNFKTKLNPLPDDKILHWSKLKQIADILKCI